MEKLFNSLSEQGKYTKSFEDFQTQFGNEEGQAKLYQALNASGDYTKSQEDFTKQFFVTDPVKTNDSASADPAVESSKNVMDLQSVNGSSEPRDASDFENTQEKDTAFERQFGKNEFTDFFGDLYRAWDAGTEAGASVNEAFDIYKGKEATDEEVYAFLEKTRNIEEKGQSDEMIAASEKMAALKKEGYNGVSAFFGSWWDNPSAMLQYSAMSLSQMVRALVDSEEVAGTAAAAAGAGASAGAGAGALLTSWSGPGALFGAGAGAIGGGIGGFFGGLSGSMETGMTTAALIQEEAVKEGLDWGNLSDKERFNYVRKIQNDTEKFNDIKSRAVSRGITIGAIDGVMGAVTGGIGNAAFKSVAAGSKSALANAARVGAEAVIETAGGMASEVAGQAAAGQEFNLEEVLIEGFADKTFTGISIAKSIAQGNPQYSINGEKMNGKQFIDNIKILDDENFVNTDRIMVENSPAVSKLISDRRQNIGADQSVDSRISRVEDRTAAINLVKEQNKLKSNPTGNKTRLTQIQIELDNIAKPYENSEVDATIEQRKQAIASAVDTKFEAQFNKNFKALADAKDATGQEPVLFTDDKAYEQALAEGFGFDSFDAFVDNEFIKEKQTNPKITRNEVKNNVQGSEGIFVGKGKTLINKAQAKRSINIATGNTGAISVASHEVLHPIFNALIGGTKEQGKFVKQFRTRMTSKQKAYVDTQLKERGYSKDATAIELMNVFSDGIIKNEISYDQTLFERLGDSIVKLFKGQGFDKLSFDNGKDVYNFLKEYNTSIKEGKLSDKAIATIKTAESKKGATKVADAPLLKAEQFSKTLTPEQSAELGADISAAKALGVENEAIAKKYGKEAIKGVKQTRLEQKVLTGLKDLIDKVVTNRTKALYDPIADDAKRNVSRQEFKDSMRADLETMTLNEYNGSQELEKFIVNRGYLRANNLAKRLGIESQEDGGIKSDIETAKDIVSTKDEQSIDRSGTVERGQATFDELDIVDEALIEDIKNDLEKEIRVRVQKGTLSEMLSVKKGRETYMVSWLENYVNKQLFKKLLKKVGAITGVYPNAVIPGAYIDFLNDPKTFDIITKALPIKSIKKSYSKLFPMEKVGRELTAEGNPVYRIKPIDKKTFLTYFLKGKKSAVLERQKQLFREILEPLAKQVVADYATPENLSELKSIQELAPEKSIDVIENISIEAQLNNLESELDRYKSEQAGFDIIQFSQTQDTIHTDSVENSRANSVAKAVIPSLRETAKAFGFDFEDKDFLLSNKAKGSQLFDYEAAKAFYTTREKLMKFMPKELTKYKGTVSALLGFVYREDGSYFKFDKSNVKKLIDKNNKHITDKATLKAFQKRSLAWYKNRLFEAEGDSKNYSEETAKLLKEYNKLLEVADLKGNEGFNTNGYRASVAKSVMNNNDIPKAAIVALKYLSKQNKLKQAAANLYISLLRDFVNTSTDKKAAVKAVVIMLVANRNTVNALRSLSLVDTVVYDAKNQGTKYHFEHNAAMARVIPEVFRTVLSDNPIDFKSKATLVPKQIAETRDSSSETKTSNETVFQELLKTEIDKNDFKYVRIDAEGNITQFSKSNTEINEDFNNIIEGATGIKGFKVFSEAKGKVRGQNKGRFKFFIPPSADDFSGLMYRLLGKGKQGDANAAWFKTNLFDPFSKGIKDYETYKEQALHIVKALKKRIKKVPNSLGKTNETGFTNEVAVRVYLWAKNGHDIPGLSKTDQKDLVEIINNDKDLKDFAEELDQTFKGYPEPNNDWLAGTVTTDMINMVNTTKRAEFLEAWQGKVDVIFSKENMNKLRAAYGNNYIEALQDMLYRMKTGRNRPTGANKMTNNFMNWFNDSVGTIMFFNTRSALLQTLSIANFINWGDNNPAKAAAAFANQKQFWADFSMLFNSNFLKQRRGGLKNDVNADDIARAAESSTNKARAVLSSILKMGFLPTQIADSFAIAMGGASFVRNRTKTYVSQGIDIKAAEEKAFLDFQEVTEETQQSSRPDRVSQQQASPLGRIILAFANTPMQYMRLTKKAFLDLKNGRGSAKTNISKIVYYTFVQNIIFSALQSALFAAAFDDDDDDKALQDKEVRIANSMLDSILRGVGIYGAIASTGKNIIMEIDRQSKKDRPDFTQAALKAVDLSPPLSSKLRKVMSTGRAFSYKSVREKMKGYGLDNPAYYAIGQSVSAAVNIPLDRVVKKADNIRVAMDNDTKLWQSIALMLGYSQWDLGLVETSATKKKKSFGKTSKWKKSSSWKKSGNWK